MERMFAEKELLKIILDNACFPDIFRFMITSKQVLKIVGEIYDIPGLKEEKLIPEEEFISKYSINFAYTGRICIHGAISRMRMIQGNIKGNGLSVSHIQHNTRIKLFSAGLTRILYGEREATISNCLFVLDSKSPIKLGIRSAENVYVGPAIDVLEVGKCSIVPLITILESLMFQIFGKSHNKMFRNETINNSFMNCIRHYTKNYSHSPGTINTRSFDICKNPPLVNYTHFIKSRSLSGRIHTAGYLTRNKKIECLKKLCDILEKMFGAPKNKPSLPKKYPEPICKRHKEYIKVIGNLDSYGNKKLKEICRQLGISSKGMLRKRMIENLEKRIKDIELSDK